MEVEPLKDENSKEVITLADDRFANQNWFTKRYLLAGILCLQYFCLSSISVNTSLALIEMTKNRTIEINGTVHDEAEFHWNSKVKGSILSAYAYGHLTSFLVTIVIKKCGGITSFGFALLLSGTLNVLYPFIIRFNLYLFLAARVIDGVFDNCAYLSTFEIWSKWAPKSERSKLVSIQFTGSYIALAAAFPISGYLAYLWHWPSTYYFTGGMAIICSSIMLLLFSNDPATDRHISKEEREYLMQESATWTREKLIYPWKQIFTSGPLWALFMLKFSLVCGMTFIGLCLPLYVKDMTETGIQNVGLISGIPNVFGIISVPIFGWLSDYIQNKNLLSSTQVHKTYAFISMALGAGCLFTIAVLKNTNFTINVIFLIIFKVLLSLSDLVTKFVPLYMAPNYSSVIAAIISYGFFFGYSLVPTLIGYLVINGFPSEWSIFLSSLGAILLTGCLVFIFLGSSEVQSWSKTRNTRDQEQNNDNGL